MSQLDEPPIPPLLRAVGAPPRVPRARTADAAALARRGRGPDRQAAVLVEAARAVRDAGRVGPSLQEALRRREAVDRATGIVMGRDRVPATAAFAHLVALARRDGRPVHDVAARLVAAVGRGG